MGLIRLPVDEVLPSICEGLSQHSSVILTAPPGSGKTTRVAPYLLQHLNQAAVTDTSDQKIFLLQPRRVAARSCAIRIAEEQGWEIGGTVGYSVRFDSKVTAKTKLVVCTEGVLLRRLQSDPILEDIGVVLFDEFHERSISSDLLLGMLTRIQRSIRPELKLVIMSATMEVGPLQSYLKGAPTIHAEGRNFPIEIEYRPTKHQQRWIDHVVDTVLLMVEKSDGDILAFLPGVGEISRVQESLTRDRRLADWDILPLHGSLSLEQQSRAIARGERPRIILATNVAETSLTLEGIRVVIDSGWVRVLRFDPAIGLDRLELEQNSKASADQRAGRAGRVQAGKCIRLWDSKSDQVRARYLEAEIRRVDIAGPLLQLFEWGEGDGGDFPWLEPPREESTKTATQLLERLGAVSNGKITPLGRSMAKLPVTPRLAKLLVEGHRRGYLQAAASIAAMLSEREPFQSGRSDAPRKTIASKGTARWDSDVLERLYAVERYWKDGTEDTPFGIVHRNSVRNLKETAKQLVEETLQELGREENPVQDREEALLQSLLMAYPDRLARRRMLGKTKGLMVGGKGVQIGATSGVQDAELFLCIDVDGGSLDATVRQASLVDESWLPPSGLQVSDELFFHPTQKQVVARRCKRWMDLVLSETPVAIENEQAASEVLYDAIQHDLPAVLPQEGSPFHQFLNRVALLREWAPELELPEVGEDLIRRVLKQLCRGRRRLEELKHAPWLDWLQSEFTSEQWRAIEQQVPERIQVPSGSWIRIEYERGKPPILAVRIQEVFSWKVTPRIAFGRVPLLLHLLAPNMRPQQVTDDLASFWKSTYEVVRKELRRRYPKHAWPEDPMTATPVSGVPRRQ